MTRPTRIPLPGSSLSPADAAELPELLIDYLAREGETWVAFADRVGVGREALVGWLFGTAPLGPVALSRVLLALAEGDDADSASLLSALLEETGEPYAAFARRAGVSHMVIHNAIRRGTAPVSPSIRAAIEAATDGAVPADGWLPTDYQRFDVVSHAVVARALGMAKQDAREVEKGAVAKMRRAAGQMGRRGDAVRALRELR